MSTIYKITIDNDPGMSYWCCKGCDEEVDGSTDSKGYFIGYECFNSMCEYYQQVVEVKA